MRGHWSPIWSPIWSIICCLMLPGIFSVLPSKLENFRDMIDMIDMMLGVRAKVDIKLISILRAFVSQFPVVSNLMKTQGWMILPLSLQRLGHCHSWRANLGTPTKFSKQLVFLRLFNPTLCHRVMACFGGFTSHFNQNT